MDSPQPTSAQPYWHQFEDALTQFKGSRKDQGNTSSGLFADILAKITRSQAGAHWRMLGYLWDRYETGLKHSREGKLNSAEQLFMEAATARVPYEANPLLNRLVDVAALPAVAYLRYKQALYQEAETLLRASIDSDAELLSEGFYILEYHRVQQLHNLARLYFKQDRLEDGARMIAQALHFVVYGHQPTVGDTGWSAENSQQIPAQLSSDMLFQLTHETASLFLAHPARNNELCQLTFANMAFWDARTDDEATLLQWFMLKEQYATGQFDEFVQASISFLTDAPVHFDYCKLSILLDIVAGMNLFNYYSSSANQVINSFMNKLNVSQRQRETCSLFFHQLLGNEQEADVLD